MNPPSADFSEIRARSSIGLIARLSAMMFLQYAPYGMWGVTVGTYITANTAGSGTGVFSPGFLGYSTTAGAIGWLLSPVLFGFLSDRYFAAQHLVALAHIGCALAAWTMAGTDSQLTFYLLLLMYYQCFGPAAALTNKIALRNLADSGREYPIVRLFGSVGWIASGLVVGLAWPMITGQSIEATRTPLVIGACGNVLMAIVAVTLPHTPPERAGGAFFLSALRDGRELVRNRPLMLFLVVSLLACVPSMAYNNYGNVFLNNREYPRPAAIMTLGQVSDVLVLFSLPWLITRCGLPRLFMAGIGAWGTRYFCLVVGSYFDVSWPVYVAIVIHGLCYVLVYVVGVMYVDRLAGETHRGAAQGIYALATTGLGHLLGGLIVGYSEATFLTPLGVLPHPYNWMPFWLVPALVSCLALVVFQFMFRPARAEALQHSVAVTGNTTEIE